jgi:hypothetical protein
MVFKFIVLASVAAASVHANAPVYGYTPAPAYGPAEPVYHTTPVYHPSPEPVYHAAEPAYHAAPAPHPAAFVHHGGPVHHAAPVHHAVVHHAPVHHAPAAYHEPKPDHYEPPKCSIDNPKTWCLEDPEYPTYEIEHALQYHYEGVQAIYKDVLANTENSVDRLKEIVQETYLCPSVTAYIQPLRAVNTDGKWRVVVNGVKAHYETLTQTARIEECTTAGESCPLVPACYETKCLQKSIYHRFLVYDAYDQYFPFAIETFKLPSACACYNGAYVEPPHKK